MFLICPSKDIHLELLLDLASARDQILYHLYSFSMIYLVSAPVKHELNINVVRITTPGSFKYLMVTLICAILPGL